MGITVRQLKTDADFEQLEREILAQKRAIRKKICHDLKTQDNRACGNPMYCVVKSINTNEYNPTMCILDIFFTNEEAKQYIENEKCYHEEDLFIYVKSGNQNEGWILARELMLQSKSDEVPHEY